MTRDEIVEIRRSLRMTQEQLAHLLGIHALTVSKWSNATGHRSPGLSTWRISGMSHPRVAQSCELAKCCKMMHVR